MISVSDVSARLAFEDGLRLPSRRFRPSPKPIATEGMPIARMREHTTAARPEKRKDFMPTGTRSAQQSCALARNLSAPLPLARLLGRVDRDRLVEVQRGPDDSRLL